MKLSSTLTLAQTIRLPHIQVLIVLARAAGLLHIGLNHIARADLHAVNLQRPTVVVLLVHVHVADLHHGLVAVLQILNDQQPVGIQIEVALFGVPEVDPNDPEAVVRPSLVADLKVVRFAVVRNTVQAQDAREVDHANLVHRHSHVADQFRTIT